MRTAVSILADALSVAGRADAAAAVLPAFKAVAHACLALISGVTGLTAALLVVVTTAMPAVVPRARIDRARPARPPAAAAAASLAVAVVAAAAVTTACVVGTASAAGVARFTLTAVAAAVCSARSVLARATVAPGRVATSITSVARTACAGAGRRIARAVAALPVLRAAAARPERRQHEQRRKPRRGCALVAASTRHRRYLAPYGQGPPAAHPHLADLPTCALVSPARQPKDSDSAVTLSLGGHALAAG
jgi:hypothetical protein